jgi:hypothetical protein
MALELIVEKCNDSCSIGAAISDLEAVSNQTKQINVNTKTAPMRRQSFHYGHHHGNANSQPVRPKSDAKSSYAKKKANTAIDPNASHSDQIKLFKERLDLRECRVPGMLSKISPAACEGRRKQAEMKNSKFMGKIKLGPCRECRYFAE